MAKEVERKWLMDNFPKLNHISKQVIKQGYLNFSPEVRIRSKQSESGLINYRLCIKSDGDLTRTEVEKELSKEEYDDLTVIMNGVTLHKDYRRYFLGTNILEVSQVDDSFYYAEIDFGPEDEANSFIAPDWFGEEVTYDKSYKMKNQFKMKNGG